MAINVHEYGWKRREVRTQLDARIHMNHKNGNAEGNGGQGCHLRYFGFGCFRILLVFVSCVYRFFSACLCMCTLRAACFVVQTGVDVSLIESTHIMSCLYISNLFYKNNNHNLYTMLSLRLAIKLVQLTYF